MDTSRYIQSCNPARFVITSSLLIFSILFTLKLDGYIRINYWLIFLPLFIWKMLVFLGGCTGIFVWCKSDESNRIFRVPDNDCRELVIYFILHILILLFELLTCDKLNNHLQISWLTCFVPLLICTCFTFVSCLWSLKVQRNFLIQAFISMNGLLFLFLPLRLDGFLRWRYVIVFTPVWISFCMASLFVLSKLILAMIYRCSGRLLSNQRPSGTLQEVFLYMAMFIPFSIFAILLVDRLDHESIDDSEIRKFSYTIISIPLWIGLFAWLTFSFGANDANPWWFGLRRDLCEILLDSCPFLPLYFNNQFKFPPPRATSNELIIDLTEKKNLDTINSNKRTSTDNNDEKNRIKQEDFFSLLQPD